MSTPASDAPSGGKRVWRAVRAYWHWPVLLGALIYLYFQVLPPIDVTQKGRAVPDVQATTLAGTTLRLSDYRGQVVVVNVWATWCAPCRVELPGFVATQQAFADRGVQFVGLSVDHAASVVRPFVDEYGLNYPQIVSPQLAQRAFPGRVVPRTYIIGPEGHVRYRHTGVLLGPALRDALEELAAHTSSPADDG
ncbi:TlpA family protein disulfide reductase [Salisaeta longa]|uniref:TlpA family protein disulfide reductase n=1 Tax=Salisaeta longa TaxID=503170 RepID=UPI000683E659|nr:TlpA disulfide reductase family protein [Salisaeta longa]